MNRKEYFRLAKMSINGHKKATKSTIRGLAIGFIIFIPIFVLLFGVNVSINKQFNSSPFLLSYEAEMSDHRINVEDYFNEASSSVNFSGSKHLDKFLNDKNLSTKIVYERHLLTHSSNLTGETTLSITGKPDERLKNFADSVFSIIDIDKSTSFFPTNLTEKFDGGIFLDGYNQNFTNNGKKQVILSEKFLIEQGLNAQDVYLKSISLFVKDKYNIANPNYNPNETDSQSSIQVPIEGYLCKEYTVVGIIKNAVSNLYTNNNFMSSDMFFTSNNVYDSNGEGVLKPYTEDLIYSGKSKFKLYKNLDNKDVLNEEYMMLGWNETANNILTIYNSNVTLYSTQVFCEAKDFKKINASLQNINSQFSPFFGTYSPITPSPVYERFIQVFDIFNAISYIFIIACSIIILCAIVNLFSTIKHSIAQRKYYLTMLRAIGARDNTLPKLYMAESFLIVSRASIYIFSIGLAISIVFKLLIDKVLDFKGISYNLSISYGSIFFCLFTVIILLYAVSMVYAYLCVRQLSKKPIVSILNKK